MIRASDLPPPGLFAARAQGAAATAASPDADTGTAWFAADPGSIGLRIGVGLGAGVRGLSATQHAERVLAALRGEGAERN